MGFTSIFNSLLLKSFLLLHLLLLQWVTTSRRNKTPFLVAPMVSPLVS